MIRTYKITLDDKMLEEHKPKRPRKANKEIKLAESIKLMANEGFALVLNSFIARERRKSKVFWEGTPTSLIVALNAEREHYFKDCINISYRLWPNNPSSLSKKLAKISKALKTKGIHVILGLRDSVGRRITTISWEPSNIYKNSNSDEENVVYRNTEPDVYKKEILPKQIKTVSFRVPVELWEAFRIRALKERTSMQKIVINLINSYLDQEKF